MKKLFLKLRYSFIHPIIIKGNNRIDDITKDYDFMKIYELCRPFTMTTIERMYALFKSVKYIINNNLQGDFVECGVWKGGSAMIIAYTLRYLNIKNRKIYLYDTFSGMSEPEDVDKNIFNEEARLLLERNNKQNSNIWAFAKKEEVERNLSLTEFSQGQLIFIEGKVEDTIPNYLPNKISLLRLDTDWYASTYHELLYLYPLLVRSGILIIDDYGHWLGAKKAVDDYFNSLNRSYFLQRIDYSGRILVKE